jgi:hypothetical protein
MVGAKIIGYEPILKSQHQNQFCSVLNLLSLGQQEANPSPSKHKRHYNRYMPIVVDNNTNDSDKHLEHS